MVWRTTFYIQHLACNKFPATITRLQSPLKIIFYIKSYNKLCFNVKCNKCNIVNMNNDDDFFLVFRIQTKLDS